MRTRILAAIAGCAIGAWSGVVRAQQDKPAPTEPPVSTWPHSVWEGVYSDDQAKRGEALYRQKCASCHGDKLTGGESAPPLAGGQFLSNWNGLALDVCSNEFG
jgi:mono/diheme cytochrome c family protein